MESHKNGQEMSEPTFSIQIITATMHEKKSYPGTHNRIFCTVTILYCSSKNALFPRFCHKQILMSKKRGSFHAIYIYMFTLVVIMSRTFHCVMNSNSTSPTFMLNWSLVFEVHIHTNSTSGFFK